jgi:hypothetical protein
MAVVAAPGRRTHRQQAQPHDRVDRQGRARPARVDIAAAQQIGLHQRQEVQRIGLTGERPRPLAVARNPDSAPVTATPRPHGSRDTRFPYAPVHRRSSTCPMQPTSGPHLTRGPAASGDRSLRDVDNRPAVRGMWTPECIQPNLQTGSPIHDRSWAVCGPSQPDSGQKCPARSRCKTAGQGRSAELLVAGSRTPDAMSGPKPRPGKAQVTRCAAKTGAVSGPHPPPAARSPHRCRRVCARRRGRR